MAHVLGRTTNSNLNLIYIYWLCLRLAIYQRYFVLFCFVSLPIFYPSQTPNGP